MKAFYHPSTLIFSEQTQTSLCKMLNKWMSPNLLKLKASAELAKRIVAGNQLPKFPQQLSDDCGKTPSEKTPCLQASPHPGMFGKLTESPCHGERAAYRSSIIPLPSGGRPKPFINNNGCPTPSYPSWLYFSPRFPSGRNILWKYSEMLVPGARRYAPPATAPFLHKALSQGLLEPCANSQPLLNIRLMGNVNFQHFTCSFFTQAQRVWPAFSGFGCF